MEAGERETRDALLSKETVLKNALRRGEGLSAIWRSGRTRPPPSPPRREAAERARTLVRAQRRGMAEPENRLRAA